ncbi:hypothetical protein IF2G_05157 [Cordyceps javanica]|nr:hypothetical protein IF2G_05157 [Cordyceps javanica]
MSLNAGPRDEGQWKVFAGQPARGSSSGEPWREGVGTGQAIVAARNFTSRCVGGS